MRSLLFLLYLVVFLAPLLIHAQEVGSQQSNPSATAEAQTPATKISPRSLGLGLAPSSSGSPAPEPESGSVDGNVYSNKYFDISYPLPQDWAETFKGPPPSGTGYYVLSQIKATPAFKGKGQIMIAATDMFFQLLPAGTTMELLNGMKHSLPEALAVERQPAEVKIAGRSFARMDYTGAGIHWYLLATEIRCHSVQFLFAGRDPEVLEGLVQGLNNVKLPPEAGLENAQRTGEFPVCIKDYASSENVLHQVNPVFVGPRFTSVPVRIIIDKDGKVKHIHVLSAFPEQARSVQDALTQWTFKPYVQNGNPVEVETGILFQFRPGGVEPKQISEKQ